jgi:hypothetical protein
VLRSGRAGCLTGYTVTRKLSGVFEGTGRRFTVAKFTVRVLFTTDSLNTHPADLCDATRSKRIHNVSNSSPWRSNQRSRKHCWYAQ